MPLSSAMISESDGCGEGDGGVRERRERGYCAVLMRLALKRTSAGKGCLDEHLLEGRLVLEVAKVQDARLGAVCGFLEHFLALKRLEGRRQP